MKNNLKNAGTALVVGGSIAGMTSARVLSDLFQKVIIVERDAFPEEPGVRKGLPQSDHIHVLMPQGAFVLERLFPGLFREMRKNGSFIIDGVRDLAFKFFGSWMPRKESGLPYFIQSRAFLDWHVHSRLETIDNIETIENADVTSLLTNSEKNQITGVVINGKDGKREIAADLVVNAAGRGSRVPRWLEELGYMRAPKSEIGLGITYASRVFEAPDVAYDWYANVIYPKAPESSRLGYLFRQEKGRWIVTLSSYFDEPAPITDESFMAFARSLEEPDIYEFLQKATPVTEIKTFKYPSARRRHYEKVRRFPAGLITLGSAVCSFNPIWGQGMTSAILQADALGDCLRRYGLRSDLFRFYYKKQKKICDIPWLLAGASDFRYPEVTGKRPFGLGLVNWYNGKFFQMMANDLEAYKEFAKVIYFMQGPEALFKPSMIGKVIKHLFSGKKAILKRPRLSKDLQAQPMDFSAYGL